ncbi:hypothetical protein AK812_SmicGene42726 [Symbiodinium microadriaticum]|uniref:Uncharacterized protein n=1 Tax=Symbiodinium microadriaticum TaxID=2951 RepID=A0A1Q9C2T2_SYMMI|nr:hypothetical protein AK812_SmicGene42726 [Symbiodinium microadriaticum]
MFSSAAAAVAWPARAETQTNKDSTSQRRENNRKYRDPNVLKEAAWLKEDLDSLRKEHADRLAQISKVENSTEDLAELRGAHKAVQEELKASKAQCDELRYEMLTIKTAGAQRATKVEDLQKDVQRLEDEKSQALAKLEEAQKELLERERTEYRTQSCVEFSCILDPMIEDLKRQLLLFEDDKVRNEGLLKAIRQERDTLRQAADDAARKRKAKAKTKARFSNQRPDEGSKECVGEKIATCPLAGVAKQTGWSSVDPCFVNPHRNHEATGAAVRAKGVPYLKRPPSRDAKKDFADAERNHCEEAE